MRARQRALPSRRCDQCPGRTRRLFACTKNASCQACSAFRKGSGAEPERRGSRFLETRARDPVLCDCEHAETVGEERRQRVIECRSERAPPNQNSSEDILRRVADTRPSSWTMRNASSKRRRARPSFQLRSAARIDNQCCIASSGSPPSNWRTPKPSSAAKSRGSRSTLASNSEADGVAASDCRIASSAASALARSSAASSIGNASIVACAFVVSPLRARASARSSFNPALSGSAATAFSIRATAALGDSTGAASSPSTSCAGASMRDAGSTWWRFRNSLTCDSGSAPENASTIWPPWINTTIGMLRTPNIPASCCSLSQSIFARRNPPAYSPASFSRIGPSVLHGPHQVAQKSTSTGVSSDACRTSVSKFASPASNTNDSAGAAAPSGLGLKFMDGYLEAVASHSKAGLEVGAGRFAVLLVHGAGLHHEVDLLHQRNVVQRIARHRDDIGVFSRRDAAEVILMLQQRRGVRGSGLDHIHRRHPRLHHVHELLGVLAVRIDAGVGAERDLDAGLVRLARGRQDLRPDLERLARDLRRVPAFLRLAHHELAGD